jgi:glycosyltransferase involved in cell wall biosynthesis
LLNEEDKLDKASLARRALHARWILSLAEPGSVEHRPLVSIVTPVYNRADLVGEAIESALAQTYQPVEVIVVDDGSTDGIEKAIEPYLGAIRFVRQENRGVSNARNHGVRLAEGDYLHFLDSDNLLSPDAVERWVEAYRCVADAEISYSPPHPDWRTTVRPEFLKPPHGGLGCPTADLMGVVARGYPFLMLSVLIPRWLVLENGGFCEWLRWDEDTRFWFHLGLRGTKVVGRWSRRNHARPRPSGLSQTPRPEGDWGRVVLLGALEVLQAPDHWLHLPAAMRRLTHDTCWPWIGSNEEPLVVETRERFLSEIERLGSVGRIRGLSPRPFLALFRAAVLESERRLGDLGTAAPFHRRFMKTIDLAVEKAAPISGADVQFWLPGLRETKLEPDFLVSLHLLAQGRKGSGSISTGEDFLVTLDRVAASAQRRPPSAEDVVGRPCSIPALPFHCRALADSFDREDWTEWNCVRTAYHAAWILELLTSEREVVGPLVSVVIPVYDRTDLLKEAVASCFAQTYDRVEVVVVDDGSAEDVEEALRPWASRLRLSHQSNMGPAAARNLGIRQAKGDLIHFLDCDDSLAPDAIERKVLALLQIPDAELVFSGASLVGDPSLIDGQDLRYLEPPVGGEGCPTHDLMREVARRYPFLTSTVLIPRWVLREVDLFDETLRRGEDNDLFFRLGLRNTKAIAVAGRLTTRRIGPGNITVGSASGVDRARATVTQALHMMRAPERWGRDSIAIIRRMFEVGRWEPLADEEEDGLDDLRSELLDAVDELEAERPQTNGPPPLFLRQLSDEMKKAEADRPDVVAAPFYALLLGKIGKALERHH